MDSLSLFNKKIRSRKLKYEAKWLLPIRSQKVILDGKAHDASRREEEAVMDRRVFNARGGSFNFMACDHRLILYIYYIDIISAHF